MTFDEEHENCEAPWYCKECERKVCPRCEPSPAEFELCAECDWVSDDTPPRSGVPVACTGREDRAHGVAPHFCIGDPGHAGAHWCLLGHVWSDANEEEAS